MVMTTVGSTGFNPYATTFTNDYLNQYAMGSNEDFMKQMYFPQDNTYVAQNPMFNLQAMQGQLTQDTFEKSSGRSKFADAATLAGLAGIGTTAGLYYTGIGGEKFNPVVKGYFNDGILTGVEEAPKEAAERLATTNYANAKKAVYERVKVNGSVINPEEHEAISKFISLKEVGQTVPKEVLDKVPNEIQTMTNFSNIKSDLYSLGQELEHINIEEITKQALEEAKKGHLGTQLEEMQKLVKRKSLIEGLEKNADAAKIEELIKKNPKVFGIEATETAVIEAEAKNLAHGWKTQQSALDNVKNLIEIQKGTVENVRNTVNSRFAHYWDSTSKTLTESAPKELKSAINSFKFNKAGRAGLIAAGIAAIIGFVFGGSKS